MPGRQEERGQDAPPHPIFMVLQPCVQNTNTHKSLHKVSTNSTVSLVNFSPQVAEVVSPPAPGCSPSAPSFLLIVSQTVLKYKQLLKGDIAVSITVPVGYSLGHTLKENCCKPWSQYYCRTRGMDRRTLTRMQLM